MNHPFYDYTILDEHKRYDFVSIGEHIIRKTIIFYKTQHFEIYTLTLADIAEDNKLDIYTVSDNGDMKKILATVLSAITSFLEYYPNSKVVFREVPPHVLDFIRFQLHMNFQTLNHVSSLKDIHKNLSLNYFPKIKPTKVLLFLTEFRKIV